MTYNCKDGPGWWVQKNAGKLNSYAEQRIQDETCLATSPDGITWTDHGRKFSGQHHATDTQPCLYHDELGGNYTYYTRRNFETYIDNRDTRGTGIYTVAETIFIKHLKSRE